MTSPKPASKETNHTVNQQLLKAFKKEFETERCVKYLCLCDAEPIDCLCDQVEIKVTLNTQYCKVAQCQQLELKQINLQSKLCTIVYTKVKGKSQ